MWDARSGRGKIRAAAPAGGEVGGVFLATGLACDFRAGAVFQIAGEFCFLDDGACFCFIFRMDDAEGGVEDGDHAFGAGHVFVADECLDAFGFEKSLEVGDATGDVICEEFDHGGSVDRGVWFLNPFLLLFLVACNGAHPREEFAVFFYGHSSFFRAWASGRFIGRD